ncbi:MAG: QueT transporter family protein [Ruminococcaceae bacterium]|nr:QueT transporter family protein [Oscillospiraceae bacterium]
MKKGKKTSHSVRYITRSAAIAVIYASLAYVSAPLQLFFFQFRLSEAMCILPIFMPEAIPGLFIGCIIANYLSGAVVFDIIFGSIATLIGALGAYALRRLPDKLMWMTTLPTVLANAFIVPFVIMYAYGSPESYLFLAVTVAVGEIVTASLLGSLFYYRFKDILSRLSQ